MLPQAGRRRQTAYPAGAQARSDELGRRHKPDYWLVALCVVLLAIGLIVVYAISPALSASSNVGSNYYVTKQLVAIGLSGVAFIITSQIPIKRWRQIVTPLLVIASLATLAAIVMPVNANYPAHRWVRLGSLSFQSVELLKFALLVWFATFLAERLKAGDITNIKRTLQPLAVVLAAIVVVVAVIQSDLGSTGVIVLMMTAMVFVAGLPMKRILLVGCVLLIGLALTVAAIPYRRERLVTFLHPESNCQTTGYQACQSLISVGSGGMVGLGLGRSVQAYGYQPEAANDSIFAIYAEKFGFVGVLVLLAIFIGFFNRLKVIAERAPDDFTRLLVVGILSWLSVQALINIGGMIGVLPLKGITLPFISYGGTSVVFVAAAVGLVFQISRYTSFIAPSMENNRGDYGAARDRRRGAYHPRQIG